MDDRFSLARVCRDTVRMLRERWASVLLVVGVFGLALLVVEIALAVHPAPSRVGMPAEQRMLRAGVEPLLRTIFTALFAGAVLHAGLIGVDWRDRHGPLAPFRAALRGFPAIFLAQLLAVLPFLISAVLVESIFARAAAPLRTLALQATAIGLAASMASLLIFTVSGLAPAAAISEALGPVSALRRGRRLMRGRGLSLFVFYFLAITPVVLLTVIVNMMFSGAYPELASRLNVLGPPTRLIVLRGLNLASQTLLILGAAAVYRELRRLKDPPATQEGPDEAGVAQIA
jgi:hypothetical protein